MAEIEPLRKIQTVEVELEVPPTEEEEREREREGEREGEGEGKGGESEHRDGEKEAKVGEVKVEGGGGDKGETEREGATGGEIAEKVIHQSADDVSPVEVSILQRRYDMYDVIHVRNANSTEKYRGVAEFIA